jgi:hypothetical protein
MSLKDDIKLDFTKLDKAALEQPELFEEWSKLWADAVFERDKIKEQLKIAEAEADVEIRNNPKKFGWKEEKSPTEAWLVKQIIIHRKVKELSLALTEAQYQINVYSSAKETIEHRGRALSILTELYKQSYFVARSRTESYYTDALATEGKKEEIENLKRRRGLRSR